jgi:hypothetical protein
MIYSRWCCLVAALAVISAAGSASPAEAPDDDFSAGEPSVEVKVAPPAPPQSAVDTEFDQLVVGGKGPPALTAARRWLEVVLLRRIDVIHRSCGLTATQKHKLRLAGHGDMKRLFDRLDDLRQEYHDARERKGYNEAVGSLGTEIGVLRSRLRTGPFSDKSLFAKAREASLSAEQSAKYAEHRQLAAHSTKKITINSLRHLEQVGQLHQDVYRFGWNRDGSRLGMLEFGKALEIRAPGDFNLLRTVGDGRKIVSFDFSPDDRLVAIGENSTQVFLVDLVSGDERLIETQNDQPSVKFSPDGTLLATGGYGTKATLWSVATGERIRDVDAGPLGGLTPVFSPDGKILAVGNRNATTRLFDVATGELLKELQLKMSHELKFSPNGKRLAVVYVEGKLAVWDVSTPKWNMHIATRPGELYSVDWSPDGSLLATSGVNGSVTLWNAVDLTILNELESPEWVICVRFSPDGARVVFSGGSTMNTPERFMEVWAVP